jgi:hypothetical protein
LFFARRLQKVNYQSQHLSMNEQRSMVRLSQIWILLLGIGTIITGYILFSLLPSLLDLIFVIFGTQTALAPSILYGLADKAQPMDACAAIASLAIGGLSAIVCLLLALGDITLLNVSLGLWSPIIVLSLSSITFLLLKKS